MSGFKRILSALTIGKIAAVDRPCQEHATVTIMKRDDADEAFWKAKYSAQDRRDMAGKEAMKDGSYPIKDAADLENAIHAVGRGKNNSHAAIRTHIKTRAKALDLSDKIPGDWKGSEVGKALDEMFAKYGIATNGAICAETFAEKFDEQLQLQNLWDKFWKGQEALRQSIESIIKDDAVIDKAAMIGQSLDEFSSFINGLVAGDVSKSLTAGIAATLAGAAGITTLEGVPMSDTLKKALGLPATATEAEVSAAVTKRDDDFKKMQAELAIEKMSDKHKAFANNKGAKLPEGGRDRFAAMTPAERDKHIEDNPVTGDGGDDENTEKALKAGDAFKSISGQIITKRAAGVMYDVVKAQDEEIRKSRDAIAKAAEEKAVLDFAKRADDLGFGKDFGPTLRKAYGGDVTAQLEVEKRIAALNKQVETGQLFSNFGKSSPQEGSAESELIAKAAEIKKAEPKLSDQQAYTRAYKDPANMAIVKRMRAEASA